MTREEMISAIESMTVLELNELVKALEESSAFPPPLPLLLPLLPLPALPLLPPLRRRPSSTSS